MLDKALLVLLAGKTHFIETTRRNLTTIVYIEEAISIAQKLNEVLDNSEYLEPLLRQIDSESIEWLRDYVQKRCQSRGWLPVIELPEL